jgi:hypothetical protein
MKLHKVFKSKLMFYFITMAGPGVINESANATVPVIQPIANISIAAGEILSKKVLISHPNRANVVVTATSTQITSLKNSLPAYGSVGFSDFAFIMPLGDINMDGVFNSADSLLLNQFMVGLKPDLRQYFSFRYIQNLLGDTNGDGVYNSADALIMNQVVSGMKTYFPPSTEAYHKYLFIWNPHYWNSISGLTYFISITATDKITNESSTLSFSVTVTTNTLPATPRLSLNPYGSLPENIHLQSEAIDEDALTLAKGITIERATSASGPWTVIANNYPIANLYAASSFGLWSNGYANLVPYHNGNLVAGTTYYYRTKHLTAGGVASKYSNIEFAKPAAGNSITPTAKKWLIVLTYRSTDGGVPFPSIATDFLCNSTGPTGMIPGLHAWFSRESKKFGKAKPFDNISCLSTQVLLPSTTYPGTTLTYSEGQWITNPLKETNVISYLETNYPEVQSADYVSVFHYLPIQQSFTNYLFNNKYDFEFVIPWPGPVSPTATLFYPALSFDHQVETVSHEFMHRLGATDKYYDTPAQACTNNPSTGLQYSGYDIMCHRVAVDPADGFYTPYVTELQVTDPTAIESAWK